MQDENQGPGGNGAQPSGHTDGAGTGMAPGEGQGAAAQLPLFYSAPEPLQEARFAGKGLRKTVDYRFAAKAHAVALHAQEFRFAAAHYPIVFSDDASSMPLAVLGYREGQNLFVDAQGQWTEGAYVPAYVRRYPFVIGQGPKPEEPILYLDRASDILVDMPAEADGGADVDPLFVEGAPSERIKQALEFCGAFQQQAPLTLAFVEAIGKHELLETKEIRLELPEGKHQLLTGLRIVDEAKFNALPDEEYLNWRRKGWVAAVYWHWASMDNFRRMVRGV